LSLGNSAIMSAGSNGQPLGLYIHVPFCERKCPYCDFNTYAGLQSLFEQMVDALCQEMACWQESLRGRTVTTVFVGGGTPTVLEDNHLERLFGAIRRNFDLADGCEITCEANPGTVDRAKFHRLRTLGVNRLSLGVQSLQPEELQFLGRIHDVEDVYRAYDAARAAGFDNINLDFIFGLPDQSLAAWQDTLDKALAFAPDHLSLYSLIVEPNTPLFHWVETGKAAAPDEDQAAELYEAAMAQLGESGYLQYEVSNWARNGMDEEESASQIFGDGQATVTFTMPVYSSRPAVIASDCRLKLTPVRACRHNLIYWRNQEYLGIGPGAHSHLWCDRGEQGRIHRRWGNRKPAPGYIKRMARAQVANHSMTDIAEFCEELDLVASMSETMMLGLRLLREGVSYAHFRHLHGVELRDVYAAELARLAEWGLVTLDADRVRVTRRGLMVGNQVFATFVGAVPELAPVPS
jgi:oxygen-independent coproporphyrinogen-3 oxidase